MKILHLNDHLSWSGGIETYLLSLLPELESHGHEQLLGFAKGDGSLLPHTRQLSILASHGSRANRIGAREIAELLRREKPDVIHIHNLYNVGVIETCIDAVPTVLHGHDYRYLCPASSFYFRNREAICRNACGPICFAATIRGRCMSLRPPYALNYYRRVRTIASRASSFSKVIANSRYMGGRFEQAGFRASQVSVLPYFCPLEPLDRPRAVPVRPTLLFIGRARPNKGYRYFVEALGRLPSDVRGIMVGDFSMGATSEVRGLAVKLGCDHRLELCPWSSRASIREVYSRATVVVVPSVWAEPLGIVGLESLACGVPVVASDVGGIREWLIEGETGRLVPPKDGAAIACAVDQILRLPDLGRSLGENGLTLIRSRFSRRKHLEDLLGLYQTVESAGKTLAQGQTPART